MDQDLKMYSFKYHTLHGSGSRNVFIQLSYAAWIRIQKRIHSSIVCCIDQDPKMYSSVVGCMD